MHVMACKTAWKKGRDCKSRMRAFWRACEGVTAIEFAFVAPVALLFTMGTIEFAMIMFVSNVMENATGNASRLGKTGFISTGISRQQTILNDLIARGGGLLKSNKVSITSTAYGQFNQIGQPEPCNDSNNNGVCNIGEYTDVNGNGQWDSDMGEAGLGGADDVVVYTVSYPWPIMTPLVRPFVGTNGIITLTARGVVKNEPYEF